MISKELKNKVYTEYVNRNCRVEIYGLVMYQSGEWPVDQGQAFFDSLMIAEQTARIQSINNYWQISQRIFFNPN